MTPFDVKHFHRFGRSGVAGRVIVLLCGLIACHVCAADAPPPAAEVTLQGSHAERDPKYPPADPASPKIQRSGRGIVNDRWSIGTHEFIEEKGYAGQKFRVAVEMEEKELGK